jgi:hypothetical protein
MKDAATEAVAKTAKTIEKGAENLVKKAWSIMDAAGAREKPSDFLNQRAVQALQGKEA